MCLFSDVCAVATLHCMCWESSASTSSQHPKPNSHVQRSCVGLNLGEIKRKRSVFFAYDGNHRNRPDVGLDIFLCKKAVHAILSDVCNRHAEDTFCLSNPPTILAPGP